MASDHGTICWNELMTRDVAAAKRYYGKVCGWTFEDMPHPGQESGTYTVARLGEEMVAGIFDISGLEGMEEVPAGWVMYIEVDDVDAAVAATTVADGEVRQPPFDIPGVGRIAMVADASGGTVGLMTSASEGA